MSMADSFILSTLLGHAKTPRQAQVALRVYDEIRRPRTQRIVESSRETGIILTGRDKETGLDRNKRSEALGSRWDIMYSIDLEKHRDEALAKLDQYLADGLLKDGALAKEISGKSR